MNFIAKTDITIIGGGIAGLWLLDQLSKKGYSTILLEGDKIGGIQTLKSQGIIHQGIKYALDGNISHSANSVSNAAKIWKDCLQGVGPIDLSSLNILSKHYYLWSSANFLSRVTQAISSKLLSSNSQLLKYSQFPEIFKSKVFKGSIYEVDEIVLDIPNLINYLFQKNENSIFFINNISPENLILNSNKLAYLNILLPTGGSLQIHSQIYLFCAGEGNSQLISKFTNLKESQIRPLHMVLLKIPNASALYGHYIDLNIIPRVTITTHWNKKNEMIWYIGGQIAETGISLSKTEQIQKAKDEMNKLLPWVDFSNSKWETVYVNRAEGFQNLQRPNNFTFKIYGNCFFVWPTKLTLTPILAANICSKIENTIKASLSETENLNLLTKPVIASPIWDSIF